MTKTAWMDEWASLWLRSLQSPGRRYECWACCGKGTVDALRGGGSCNSCGGKGYNLKKEGAAAVDRTIIDCLKGCRTFDECPPEALIELISYRLLAGRPRKAKPRDSQRWIMAARYCAVHPSCTVRELVSAVRHAVPTQKFALKTAHDWRKDSDFQAELNFQAGFATELLPDFPSTYRELFVDPFE